MAFQLLLALSQVLGLATAIVAGIFVTFSDFVMRSLDRSARSAGIEVMQAINREVFPTLFMGLFLGLTVVSVLVGGYAALNLEAVGSVWLLTASALYLFGVFGVTAARNVPMNNHLATLDHGSDGAAHYWTTVYRPSWTFWNHFRSAASMASAGCYLMAGIVLAQAS